MYMHLIYVHVYVYVYMYIHICTNVHSHREAAAAAAAAAAKNRIDAATEKKRQDHATPQMTSPADITDTTNKREDEQCEEADSALGEKKDKRTSNLDIYRQVDLFKRQLDYVK